MTKIVEWSVPHDKDIEFIYSILTRQGLVKNKAKLKNTIHLQCTRCNVKIHSSYSGEYVSCTCGKISIDQTDFYARMIGNEGDYLVVNKEEVYK